MSGFRKDAKRVNIYGEAEVVDQAKKKAADEGKSLSQVIMNLLKKWLKGEVDA